VHFKPTTNKTDSMEHLSTPSSNRPSIEVLPKGFTDRGRRSITLVDGGGWTSVVFGIATLVLLLPLAFAALVGFLGNALKNQVTLNEWLMFFGFIVISLPFFIGPIWYFWFVLSRRYLDYSDPIELLWSEGIRNRPDRLTVLRRSFLGTDSAIILDHRNSLIHFFNCHVAKGFIPRVMRVYTCQIDSLGYHEKTVYTEEKSIIQGILTSSDGSTTLGLNEPGVLEFLELVNVPS
jgi:hypothetical protein